jgi:hypothetical protein
MLSFLLLGTPWPFSRHPFIHLACHLRVSGSGRSLQNRPSAETGWLVTNDLGPVRAARFLLEENVHVSEVPTWCWTSGPLGHGIRVCPGIPAV